MSLVPRNVNPSSTNIMKAILTLTITATALMLASCASTKKEDSCCKAPEKKSACCAEEGHTAKKK